MTFQDYINNPTGTKTAVMSHRGMYEDLYHGKWNKIMVREGGHINYDLYTSKNSYYCHVKVPSEVIKDFYYDVVIKLTPENKLDKNLAKASVEFFSNDPSFNYTFAYAFVKAKLHIPELEPRMSKEAIHKKANEKNPQATIGYVKALYFAYIAMSEKGLFNTIRYKSEAKPFDKKLLLSKIKQTEECIEERTNAQLKITADKKLARQKSKPTNEVINPEVHGNRFIKKTTSSVGRIGSIGKGGKSGSGNINKIGRSKTRRIGEQ